MKHMTRIAAALVASMTASPVMASSDAVCQDIANNTGWNTGTWNATDSRCVMSGRNVRQQQQIEQADGYRNHPDARAVYYGTPPAANGAATASMGSGMICINMPSQDPKLTRRYELQWVNVRGNFTSVGRIDRDQGRQCIPGGWLFRNATVGSEFPVTLSPGSIGARIDATDPNMYCTQTQPANSTGVGDEIADGRCLQWHYGFRKLSHCIGNGPVAVSCRIWVEVEN